MMNWENPLNLAGTATIAELMPYKDPEKQKQYFADYREIHRQHCRDISSAWRVKNAERIAEYFRKFREKNRERLASWMRGYRKRNPDKHRQSVRKYYQTVRGKEVRRRSAELYNTRHPEKLAARWKRWEAKHPGARHYAGTRRRMRKLNLPSDKAGIVAYMEKIKAQRFANCYYCGRRVLSKSMHFDHVKALANGGRDRVDNLCVSCKGCNLKKHAKHLIHFVVNDQRMLGI